MFTHYLHSVFLEYENQYDCVENSKQTIMEIKMMKFISKNTLFIALVITSTTTTSIASPADRGDRRPGPPQEAIDACKDKAEGDAASFVSSLGDTITGICKTMKSEKFLIPDGHHPHGAHGAGMRERSSNI